MGYTPSLAYGAWVGGDERDVHFASMSYGQGAAAALPIAAKFLKRVYAIPTLGYSPDETFQAPQGAQYDAKAAQTDSTATTPSTTSNANAPI